MLNTSVFSAVRTYSSRSFTSSLIQFRCSEVILTMYFTLLMIFPTDSPSLLYAFCDHQKRVPVSIVNFKILFFLLQSLYDCTLWSGSVVSNEGNQRWRKLKIDTTKKLVLQVLGNNKLVTRITSYKGGSPAHPKLHCYYTFLGTTKGDGAVTTCLIFSFFFMVTEEPVPSEEHCHLSLAPCGV